MHVVSVLFYNSMVAAKGLHAMLFPCKFRLYTWYNNGRDFDKLTSLSVR